MNTEVKVSAYHVMTAACRLGRVRPEEMRGPSRRQDIVYWRQRAAYVARIMTTQSYPQIAMAFGSRDHTTMIFAARKIFVQLAFTTTAAADVERLMIVARQVAEREAAERARIREASELARVEVEATEPEASSLVTA